MVDIERLAELANEFGELYQEGALNGVSYVLGKKRIHLTYESFMETFTTWSEHDRGCLEYPKEYTHNELGVEFFCIK